jgi:hypothetical protein
MNDEKLLTTLVTDATQINKIIDQLEELIQQCITSNDRIGYFASLYHKVTVRVRDGIVNNEFEDNARMEKLDVIFANRFLTAVKQFKNNQQASGSWMVAFSASKKSSVLVLQQLLLGINAHINFDLGIAASEATGDNDIRQIKNDFNSINYILGSLTFEVLNEINRVSPLLSLFGLHATNDTTLIQFSLTNARDGAWCFGEDLHSKKNQQYATCIAERDQTISKLATSLIKPTGLIKITMFIIHLFEWKRPAKIINSLHGAKKKFIHPE